MIRIPTCAMAAILACGLGTGPASAQDVMVVYDASGSMWGQIDGVTKIEIARDVLGDLVNQWPAETNLGLVAYGHRREGDCSDIETVLAPQPISPATFTDAVNAINPLGRTPLSAAVEHAAEELVYLENPATVVLISDGIENCEADPCALATHLEERGIAFTTHVIGFDVASDEYAQLSCIAENTGGVFVPASNASELADALAEVKQVIETAPEPQPEPEAELPPEPEPEIVQVDIKAPSSVTVGMRFPVSWAPTLDASDYVTIVPVGADEGSSGNYQRVADETEQQLRAPAETGLYEVRYVVDSTGETAGAAQVEVVDANVTIAAPETVTTGARFTVDYTGAVDGSDYVTIVPVGADEGSYGDYRRVGDAADQELTAPAETGLYEVRYVLDEGARTLASAPVEVVEAQVSVSAPKTVTVGARFTVGYDGVANGSDYVTIVPVGADEGSFTDYRRVGDAAEQDLTAPAEPGLYEVRYVLDEGGRTLASTPVEVVEGQATISAPETVTIGARFTVDYTGAVNGSDYVTIVAAGAEEGSFTDYRRVGDATAQELTAPAEPGLYEVRYVLDEGGRTLASTPVEVVAGDVSVSAPGVVIANARFTVTYTGAINVSDYVTIVRAGADEGDFGDYRRVGDDTEQDLTAPEDPGLYEVRYVLDEGARTLASTPVEVLEEGSAIDFGAGLDAPSSAAPGETILVSWTADVEGARIALARPDQADFAWIEAQPANSEMATKLQLPDEPGTYEVRFLDVANQSVMGRSPITVE
ncbi:VWA domain-containing protein [Pelagibacterium sp.]|uniref:VWA domain-containing protein n=1 Tax=Pelagibacterium sp. TaxID=1967288 RepID=UPI003A941848